MKKRILCVVMMIAFALSGCSDKKGEQAVAYVGEMPVSEAEFRFYLDNVKEQMQGTELSDEEDWQNKEIDGQKAIEVAKERALDIAAVNLGYIEIYKKSGKSPDDEKEKIALIKNDMVGQYSDGGYDDFLKENNIDDAFVDMLCESTYCAEALYDEFVKNNNDMGQSVQEAFDKYIKEKMNEYGIKTVQTELIKKIN